MFRFVSPAPSPEGPMGLSRCGHEPLALPFLPTEPRACCDSASPGPGPRTLARWRITSGRPIVGVALPAPMPRPIYKQLRAAVAELAGGIPMPSPRRDDTLSDNVWEKLPSYRLTRTQWHRVAAVVHAIAPATTWSAPQHITTERCAQVVHAHGPRGIALLELALPVLRSPHELGARLCVLDDMVMADEAAILALRPLLGECQKQGIAGRFLPQLFRHLCSSPDPARLAQRITANVHCADAVIDGLGLRSKELWFSLSGSQPARRADVAWRGLVAPPMLALIERIEKRAGHTSAAYLEATQSLVALIDTPGPERIPFYRLCRPLCGQPIQPTGLAGLLLLFGAKPHPVRARAVNVLESAGALGPQSFDTLVNRTRMAILTPQPSVLNFTAEEPR